MEKRQIKFRALDMSGRWQFGYYYFGVTYPESFEQHRIGGWVIDAYTLGQFTGLKDMKGADIYEGDILKTYPILASDKLGDNSFNVVVRFDQSCWLANGILGVFQCRISEIIGNIYENPELLDSQL